MFFNYYFIQRLYGCLSWTKHKIFNCENLLQKIFYIDLLKSRIIGTCMYSRESSADSSAAKFMTSRARVSFWNGFTRSAGEATMTSEIITWSAVTFRMPWNVTREPEITAPMPSMLSACVSMLLRYSHCTTHETMKAVKKESTNNYGFVIFKK